MTVEAIEFIRRFLLHVLPSSFVKIRYYGFMANRHRKENLRRCRELLGHAPAPADPQEPAMPVPAMPSAESDDAASRVRCPACQQGTMRILRRLERQPGPWDTSLACPASIVPPDTS